MFADGFVSNFVNVFSKDYSFIMSCCTQNSHNKQNSRLLCIWCGLWYDGNNGPYFSRNEAENIVSINSERYNMILNVFLPFFFDKIHAEDFYLQQDGAPPHI